MHGQQNIKIYSQTQLNDFIKVYSLHVAVTKQCKKYTLIKPLSCVWLYMVYVYILYNTTWMSHLNKKWSGYILKLLRKKGMLWLTATVPTLLYLLHTVMSHFKIRKIKVKLPAHATKQNCSSIFKETAPDTQWTEWWVGLESASG